MLLNNIEKIRKGTVMKTLKKPGDVRQELSWYEMIAAMKDTTPENQELFITLHAREYNWHRRDNQITKD